MGVVQQRGDVVVLVAILARSGPIAMRSCRCYASKHLVHDSRNRQAVVG